MATKNNPVHYLITLILIMSGTFLVMLPVPLINTNVFVKYLIVIFGGLAMGHLSCMSIDKVMHSGKKEFIAGIITPLPAAILLYAVNEFFKRIDIMIIEASSAGGAHLEALFHAFPNSILLMVFYFLAFNIQFLIFYYKKHRDKRILAYYIIAPVVMAAGVVIVNAWLGAYI